LAVLNLGNNARAWQLRVDGGDDNKFCIFDVTRVAVDLAIDTSGRVGIGTTAPSQRLTVAGVIESTTGGFKFPDGTLQNTAAVRGPKGDKGDKGERGEKGEIGPPGIRTVAACGPALTNGCAEICRGSRAVSAIFAGSGVCTVTADTGSCTGAAGAWCCVCAP
jgi:hypothetical protein